MSRFYEALQQHENSLEHQLLGKVEIPASQCEEVATANSAALADEVLIHPNVTTEMQELPSSAMHVVPKKTYRVVRTNIGAGMPLFPFGQDSSEAAEEYRILRTTIRQHPNKPKCIAVSSASPNDGKTITAINLAGILAKANETRVLLIDTDMRRPSVALALGIPASPGLADVLAGYCSLQDAIVEIEGFPGLHVLPSGDAQNNPAELLASDRWTRSIVKLREQFTTIVCDTTPIAAVADFNLVKQASDGLILVVRPDNTNRTALRSALAIEPKSMLLGVIVNASEDWFLWQKKSSYGRYAGYKN